LEVLLVRIFVAGGAGAIGRFLVPMLVAASHDVTATTRKFARAAWLESVGATAITLDAFDADAVADAVQKARPTVVIDELTDLSSGFDDASLRRSAKLRMETTPILIAAAERAGVRRLVAQSGAWLYAPGREPHTEIDPLVQLADRPRDPVLPGVRALERSVSEANLEGRVLRYGYLYGPGTSNATPGEEPTVHVAAAARATLLAVDRGGSAVYNIVDDGRLVSNALARLELGWDPAERSFAGATSGSRGVPVTSGH
jgi:nucleoside-diphosphate-sugar epimerase